MAERPRLDEIAALLTVDPSRKAALDQWPRLIAQAQAEDRDEEIWYRGTIGAAHGLPANSSSKRRRPSTTTGVNGTP
ncbi:MAG TPA: hypothetical protein VFW64_17495 [Pseudonocardiaceae bacterium]|nr:hypothetical protein [Pseudonocardiaceae bacterium]